jgi:hypothetical protein
MDMAGMKRNSLILDLSQDAAQVLTNSPEIRRLFLRSSLHRLSSFSLDLALVGLGIRMAHLVDTLVPVTPDAFPKLILALHRHSKVGALPSSSSSRRNHST